MRDVIFDRIYQEMLTDSDSFLITADTGFGLLDRFFAEFGKRVINVGIAEQLAVGMAAGIADRASQVICYGISNFMVHRCIEMIRNDLCINKKKVIILGTSTGYENSKLGPTHHIIDDIISLWGFHGLEIYSPIGKNSAKTAIECAFTGDAPAYIRICKSEMDDKYAENGIVLNKERCDVPDLNKKTILCYGFGATVVSEAVKGRDDVEIVAVNRVIPVDYRLGAILKDKDLLYIYDDSSARQVYRVIADYCATNNLDIRLVSISPSDGYFHDCGTHEQVLKALGIDTEGVLRAINR